MANTQVKTGLTHKKNSFWYIAKKDLIKNKYAYVMIVPVIAFFIIFQYAPMYGAIIAFKNYVPRLGFLNSPWVGFEHFITFFNSHYFYRVFQNTVLISFYDILFGFPAPLIFALMLNEVRKTAFKKTVQTITYMPYFISLVVVAGMIVDFTASDGVINDIVAMFGGTRTPFLQRPENFRTIYILSNIWQNMGWRSVIYLAALAAIDQEQYEAATIDGAGRFRQIWSVTIPGIMPTVIILLILKMGQVLSVGFEKIILLYNPNTYEVADVISSFIYRRGLLEANFSFSTAVGLFNSVVNFSMLILVNTLSRKLNDTSLW